MEALVIFAIIGLIIHVNTKKHEPARKIKHIAQHDQYINAKYNGNLISDELGDESYVDYRSRKGWD